MLPRGALSTTPVQSTEVTAPSKVCEESEPNNVWSFGICTLRLVHPFIQLKFASHFTNSALSIQVLSQTSICFYLPFKSLASSSWGNPSLRTAALETPECEIHSMLLPGIVCCFNLLCKYCVIVSTTSWLALFSSRIKIFLQRNSIVLV